MRPRVLILCTANSARSQMAEGLLRNIVGAGMEIYSAGSKPSVVHPLALAALRERGIDISQQTSKHLSQFLTQPFDYVITVCDSAAETCPLFPGPAVRIHWSFPDPAAVQGDEQAQLASFRTTRDAIEQRLKDWVSTL